MDLRSLFRERADRYTERMKKKKKSSKMSSKVKMVQTIVLTVLVWYTTQIAASLMMKKVMKRTIISPLNMTLANLAISCSLDYVFVEFVMGSRLPKMNRKFAIRALPIAVSLLIVKAFTLMGYEYITISLAHTIKSCEPVFTVAFSIVGYRMRFSRLVYFSLIPMVGGAVMAAYSDVEFHLVGVLAIITATVFQSLQRLFNKDLLGTLTDAKVSNNLARILGVKYWIAFLGLMICIPLAILSKLVAASSIAVEGYAATTWIDTLRDSAPPIIVSSAFQWLAGAASYYLLALIAPLSHSVAKITERMLLILISVVLFQSHAVSFINIVGILIALAGVMCYVFAKHSERHHSSSANGSSSTTIKSECKGGGVEMAATTTTTTSTRNSLNHV